MIDSDELAVKVITFKSGSLSLKWGYYPSHNFAMKKSENFTADTQLSVTSLPKPMFLTAMYRVAYSPIHKIDFN